LSEVPKIVPNRGENFSPIEAWIRVDGLNIRFWRAGSGPSLVLLHGLLGYSFSWRHAIPILAEYRTVYAPDMPGAGLSDCGPNLDCRLSSTARRVNAFLDSLAISDCDLTGSSYGGTTAMMVARLAPARVRSLTLVSPANPWSRIGTKRLRLLREPAVAWIFPKLARPMRGLHSYFVRRMYGNARKVTPETLLGYARPLSMPGRFEHAVRIARTWSEDMRELEASLPRIASVPTLLVWGSKDRVVDPASADFLSRHFQSARTVVIPGAGHLPYEECPEEFCLAVTDFLAAVPSRSTEPTER
jgi:pimeloyl-ACP methyl ester carboxylesterase